MKACGGRYIYTQYTSTPHTLPDSGAAGEATALSFEYFKKRLLCGRDISFRLWLLLSSALFSFSSYTTNGFLLLFQIATKKEVDAYENRTDSAFLSYPCSGIFLTSK